MAGNECGRVNNISVDDGLEKIVITNKLGNEIGVFYFRPTDTGIIDRYNEALTRLDAALEPITSKKKSASPNEDPEVAAQAIRNTLSEARGRLCEVFDYLFDANVSEAFFSRVDPFTVSNGRFYCENVIEAIGAFIEKRIGVEVKRLNDRTSRYTHGYRTGKHKAGKK